MSFSQAKEKILKLCECIVYAIFGYVALWFLTWVISALSVNPGISYEIRKAMYESGCKSSVKTKDYNPANVFNFYLDFDYWTADYRLGIAEFNDAKCKNVLIQSINMFEKSRRSIKVLIVDENNNILMSIKRYPKNEK